MKFVRIDPGEFLMGSPQGEKERKSDETQHKVKVTRPFMMGVHAVTRGQFAAFVDEAGYETDAENDGWAYAWTGSKWDKVKGASWRNPGFEQDDTHPVTEVSWNDAGAFVQWLGGKEDGKGCRLPTEAEWEYACRAGTTTPFYTGETISTEQANYNGNFTYGAGVKGVYRQKTTPVGSFKPNAWGLFDMHGNVWEWCADAYAEYPAGPATGPTGPTPPPQDASRVLRGGSWDYKPGRCRSAQRLRYAPGNRVNFIGFRVVLDSR
jgi:formylglycine-generating enzyme required for sulfatase activity